MTPVAADEVYTASSQVINIDPTYVERGEYIITATYTPVNGDPISAFTVATIKVECLVTSFTNPPDPASQPYIVFDPALTLDLAALAYVQSPACNYPYTVEFNWSAGTVDGFISATTAGALSIQSDDPTLAQNPIVAMTAEPTITISASADVDHLTDAVIVQPDFIEFNVEVSNPCASATITPLQLSPSNPSVKDGETVVSEWNTPTNSVDTTYAQVGLCGEISYAIVNDNNGDDTPLSDPTAQGGSWATIETLTSGRHRITFNTMDADLL
jgi:hypothetical protein